MKIYSLSKSNFFLICVVIILTVLVVFILTSCKDKTSNDSSIKGKASKSESTSGTSTGITASEITSKSGLTEINTGNNQVPFSKAARWGPVNIFKGYVGDLIINGNTGIGSVSYDIGDSTEGTYIYAINITSGELIGDVKISGPCYGIDICERYAFILVKDGIYIYDLNNKFELVQAITQKSIKNEWVSNFGNYFFVEDRQAPDYLIDKKTLQKVDLNQVGLNVSQDDQIYALLYPDCLIGDPAAFTGANSGNPVVYSLKEGKILGYIPSGCLSGIFAWDPQNKLFFCHDLDRIMVYDLDKGDFISEVEFTQSETYSIAADTKKNPQYYFGVGDRLHVIREFSLSENGFYFFNGKESAYVLGSSGVIICQQKKSDIIGEYNGYIFYEKEDSLGIIANGCGTLWLNQKPEKPFHMAGPNFTENSIVWLGDSSRLKGHGDGIYQWSYKTGSYLNYTEFTGYEVKILSSQPLILAMRRQEGGVNADWHLISYEPSKLPFNFIPDIRIDYSPDSIYSNTTKVKFTCTVKNLPVEFQSQNISYEWDFGDGEKGSGKEAAHMYEKSGNYDVRVSVKIGDSLDSSTESTKVKVLETPDIRLIASPQFYSENGLVFELECKNINDGRIGYVEWDFGDGKKGNGILVSHAYETGSYIATATIYSYDKKVSWKKEIPVNSKFPEFLASASSLEGYSALIVDFNCALLSSDLTDSGLKYKWSIGPDVISEKSSFKKAFVYPGTYTVTLEITDPALRLVKEQSFDINVYNIYLGFTDEGREIESNTPIFIDKEYDIDKDGINQAWEDVAMTWVNPYFELDEEEDLLDKQDTDKVVNFVRITPYQSVGRLYDQQYILFFYCVTFTRDYGRYADLETGFHAHNGDIETVVMAWKVIDNKNLELNWVYTSAHGSEDTSHSAVWKAKGETANKGKVKYGLDETMYASLEYLNNILKLQISEDKHAIYPTEECGDDVTLVANLIGEDCGGGGVYRFECYNAGEPDAYLMDDIGYIFPNESIWSGNKNKSSKFFGGRSESDNSPKTIGRNLSGIPAILKKIMDDNYKGDQPDP